MNVPDRGLANTDVAKSSFAWLFLTIFVPFGLGHFVSYLYRTVNAVIYGDLSRDLGLPPESLGLLTAVYFLTFALAQLPLGVLLDRYGPRSVQSPMLLIASGGALIFASADTTTGLLIGRGMIGLGVAGSLMSAIKACSIWLPTERLPLSTACLLSVGGFGAMASTAPMHTAMEILTWREAFWVLALMTLLVSAFIHFSVKKDFTPKTTRLSDMCAEVGRLYQSSLFWRLALYSIFANATYMAVLALWMAPWLQDVGGLNEADMANALLLGTVGMVLGSLGFGWLTDYVRKFHVRPLTVCGVGIALFVLCQVMMLGNVPVSPYLITLGFSFFGTASTMNYAIVAQSVEPSLAGRVSASFNLLIFLLAFFIQWFVGLVIGLWPEMDGRHPLESYQWSFGVLIVLQVLGLLAWLSFKPWALELNRS